MLAAGLGGCGAARHSSEAGGPTSTTTASVSRAAVPSATTTSTTPTTAAPTSTSLGQTSSTKTTPAHTTSPPASTGATTPPRTPTTGTPMTGAPTTGTPTTGTPTTTPPGTSTTTGLGTTPAPAPFPAIVNQAMEALQPPASGMEAPATLPATTAGAISAEATKSLDGSYSVTLIATPKPEGVNSPELGPAAANLSSDLGTFSTTPVDSAQAAASYLASALTGCAGPPKPLHLPGTDATACNTAQGPAVDWGAGAWKVQVLDQGGTAAPLPQAADLSAWLAGHDLPPATQGVVTVTVPGGPQAGTAVTSAVIWYVGHDVYQVSAPGRELAALDLAGAMKPWPGG